MVGRVAGKGAIPAEKSGAGIFNAPGGTRGHVVGIEVNEMLVVRDAVGIMTGGAGCFLFHNMEPMPAILAETVHRPKTLVA